MGETTNIEWCDRTFNPWIGCTKVSPACDHCYAEALMDTRHKRAKWGPGNPRSRTAASTWKNPLKWQRQATAFAEEHGRRQRVFCASLADVFDNEVPTEWRADLFELICATPELDWLLLTKRIGNVKKMLAEIGMDALPNNVWLGATICNQAEADRDVPKLMKLDATVRFLSMEPLLGPVDLTEVSDDGTALDPECWGDCNCDGLYGFDAGCCRNGGDGQLTRKINWVIVGGESGHGARPMNPAWAISLRDQCERAGTAFLFKQWGEWVGIEDAPDPLPGKTIVDTEFDAARVGKKAAGRLLQGRTHDEFPA